MALQFEEKSYTPREVVSELDRYIVGQNAAKRAVAIALRNRWRRKRVPAELRDEISPKNIILIGATGVGKTEIARRLAKLSCAPFIKVEASKFTEVGYMGRDVDSMIRDLIEIAVRMVENEAMTQVKARAAGLAEDRLLDLLLPKAKQQGFELRADEDDAHDKKHNDTTREEMRVLLREGSLKERSLEMEAEERRNPTMQVFSNTGMEEMGVNINDMMGQLMGGKKTRKRRVSVEEAREILIEEESEKLIDKDAVIREAIRRTEETGIVFLDEIDKIARGAERQGSGPDISREGVQRDILPIVEGSTVSTKYGMISTDHILFVAAGAFHVSKVSDLIPELQGRFPIRVELEPLDEKQLLRILKEPQNALPKQYAALLATESLTLSFEDEALAEVARIAAEVNRRSENIGARRLHTVLEKLLEEISFSAPERSDAKEVITAERVRTSLAQTLQDEDLERYIL